MVCIIFYNLPLLWGERSGQVSALHSLSQLHTHIPPLQRISYAKGKSDAVAKEDGTFKPKAKKMPEEGSKFIL